MALYVGDQRVVEATFDGGITITHVDAYIERDSPAEVGVKRLKDIEGRERIIREAIEYALDQEGKLFDPAVFIFPLFHKIGDKEQHCVELVWRAYRQGGIDLDSNRELMLLPDDVYYSPYLEDI